MQFTDLIDWFALSRQAGVSNVSWRWLTAHLAHFSLLHYLANLLGFVVISVINRSEIISIKGIINFLILSIWVSAGIWLLNPEITAYAGLSGVLHGLFFITIARSACYRAEIKVVLLSGWLLKVVAEQWGIVELSHWENILGVAVAIDAHLYGLLGGILVVLLGRSRENNK